ncbi:sensor histidine kinase [Selenomonas sp. KH1T6]|uniref:sensor histidine kinase n=1 Tax=Selenomonas sp. KH1T6 TaxID=3158784 RepID=UPI0008A7BE67|nr:two-component system, NarL family, sensor histidine kinase DegS [Selenomonas ruminantium]
MGKSKEFLDEAGNLSTDALKSILNNTIDTIESNKAQIFEIYETARDEVERSKQQLAELKTRARETIDRVDSLAKEEQREKQNLVRVSGNFAQYSEESIKATYEKVKDIQVALGVEREKEADLRERRDKLELRLRKLGIMLDQAEHLALAIGSVFSYLASQVSGVMWKIEAVQKEQFVGARVIKAQEEERYRMSREIHDGPAQDMANMLIQTSIIEKLMDKDIEEARRTLQELRLQIKECLGSVRQIIFDMRPMALDDLGLVPALQQLVSRLAIRGMIATDFSVDGNVYDLPKHAEIAVFRIVQEALNNIVHHAGVQEAKVRLLYTGAALSVLVEDKGAGFDPEARRAEIESAGAAEEPAGENAEDTKKEDALGHFGMIGMEERARIIGAQLKVLSAPGEGTRVHLRLERKALGQKERKH